MTQLQMFDPRIAPTATKAMLDDGYLRRAIADMRGGEAGPWPYVEHVCEFERRPVWLVDDGGLRYFVIDGWVWEPNELKFATVRLRTAALEALARLDEIGKQGVAA